METDSWKTLTMLVSQKGKRSSRSSRNSFKLDEGYVPANPSMWGTEARKPEVQS